MLASFRAFKGERVLRRPITESRVATAWLTDRVMIGGEITGKTLAATPGSIRWIVRPHPPGGEHRD